VSELWHLSEDPTIELFHPHQSELHALDEPLVWAVDTHYQWLYRSPATPRRGTSCASRRRSTRSGTG
jgi:hypothetical protein